ncbi:hypothetical protein DSECCO2_656680 [anaerobic digester metagenome]
MQDGVLHAADVLVHGHPVLERGGVECAVILAGAGVAREIPRGLHEGVHGVGFAAGLAPALGAGAFREFGGVGQGRAAILVGAHFQRQQHGQVLVLFGHHAAGIAVHHGNGCAPVTLARDVPVAQAVVDGAAALAGGFQRIGDLLLGGLVGQAVEFAGIDQQARLGPGGLHGGGVKRVAFRLDDHLHGQVVLAGEFEVALVVRGHGHDRAGAVFGQHEVGHPDGHAAPGEGVHAVGAGEHPFLLEVVRLAHDAVHVADAFHEGAHRRGLGLSVNELFHQRMFWGKAHEGGAEHGVLPGGEHGDGTVIGRSVGPFQREHDFRADGLADPVALHAHHALGPARLQLVEVGQQFFRVVGDAQEPLGQVLLLHGGIAAPAQPFDDLLVGEHGVALGAPVLRGLLAVHQALFEEPQEELLLPAVVFGRAGGQLAPPVIRVAKAAQLGAHVVDVGKGPLGGMGAVLDGGVFRRQPEGVPAHGVQHVEALHALEARHHVADGVVAHVPHVDVARRVGEHLEHVVLGLVGVVVAVEGAAFFPGALPFDFDGLVVVFHAAFGFHAAMVLVGWSVWIGPCGLAHGRLPCHC